MQQCQTTTTHNTFLALSRALILQHNVSRNSGILQGYVRFCYARFLHSQP